MRCLDEATATALGGEATIPISSAWACCFLVTACTAVLDYERAFEWCDRIAEFAERYGSRYMLAFCRAEYGAVAPLARPVGGGGGRCSTASVDDFARSRPAWVAVAARRAGGAAAAAGQAGRGGDAARRDRRLPAGAARAALAWRSTAASRCGPSSCSSGCCASCPPTAALDRAPGCSSCSSAPGSPAASSTRPRPPLEELAGGRAARRHRAAAGPRRPRRGDARGRPRRSRARAAAARGCRRPLRAERRAVRGRARRGSSSPRACSRSAAPTPPSERRPPPWIASSSWAPSAEAERARRLLEASRRAGGRSPLPEVTRAGARGAAACSPRG